MSWQGKAEETEYVEEVNSTRPPGFGAKVKRHFRRFWWLHLLFFIASTLIIVLCLIYVAFPRISQNDINDSTLTISSLILSNPKPDSFHLVQTSVIGNGSPYHPNLDAFNASLSLDGSGPYAYVEIPQVHATKQATSIIDQDVSITDLAAFTDYNIAVLGSETVKVDVRGRTALHEMKFPDTTVNYEKTVSMKGTHYGLSIMDAALIDPPRLEQTQRFQRHRVLHRTNARARRHQHDGTVYIPNPTVMTIAMGNVTFNNYIASTQTLIGTTTLTNLTLAPGNNTIPMRSTVNQTLVLTQILTTFKDGMLPIDIVGNSSVYDGRHLPYFEKALASVTQHVTLDVGSALKKVGLDPSKFGGSPP